MESSSAELRLPPKEGADQATVSWDEGKVSGSFLATSNVYSRNWFLSWAPHLTTGNVKRHGQFYNYPATYPNDPNAPVTSSNIPAVYAKIDPGLFGTYTSLYSSSPDVYVNPIIHFDWNFTQPFLVELGNQPIEEPNYMPTPQQQQSTTNGGNRGGPFLSQDALFPYSRLVDGWISVICKGVASNKKVLSGTIYGANISDFRQGQNFVFAGLANASLCEDDFVLPMPLANGMTLRLGPDVLSDLRPTMTSGVTNGSYSTSGSTQQGVLAEYVIGYQFQGVDVSTFTPVNSDASTIAPTVGFPLLSAFGPMYFAPNLLFGVSTAVQTQWQPPPVPPIFPPYPGGGPPGGTSSATYNWGGPNGKSLSELNGMGGFWISPSLMPSTTSPGPTGSVGGFTIPMSQSVLQVAPISPFSMPYIEVDLSFQYGDPDAFLPPGDAADVSKFFKTGPFHFYHLYGRYNELAGDVNSQLGSWEWNWEAEMASSAVSAIGPLWPFLQSAPWQGVYQEIWGATPQTPGEFPYEINTSIPGVGPYLPNQVTGITVIRPNIPLFTTPSPNSNIFPGNTISTGGSSTNGVTTQVIDSSLTLKARPMRRAGFTWMGCMVYNFDTEAHANVNLSLAYPNNWSTQARTPVIPVITRVRFGSQDASDFSGVTPARVVAVADVGVGQEVLIQGKLAAQLIPTQSGANFTQDHINRVFTSMPQLEDSMIEANSARASGQHRVERGAVYNSLTGMGGKY